MKVLGNLKLGRHRLNPTFLKWYCKTENNCSTNKCCQHFHHSNFQTLNFKASNLGSKFDSNLWHWNCMFQTSNIQISIFQLRSPDSKFGWNFGQTLKPIFGFWYFCCSIQFFWTDHRNNFWEIQQKHWNVLVLKAWEGTTSWIQNLCADKPNIAWTKSQSGGVPQLLVERPTHWISNLLCIFSKISSTIVIFIFPNFDLNTQRFELYFCFVFHFRKWSEVTSSGILTSTGVFPI